jgi:hypothetical protein
MKCSMLWKSDKMRGEGKKLSEDELGKCEGAKEVT